MQTIKFKSKEWDYSYKSMSWWDKEKVKHAKVMVVGCGALGNEVIKNLVLMNIGHIVIVDFDDIEYSNLSRSILFDQENATDATRKVDAIKDKVKAINPSVHVEAIHGDIRYGVGLSYFNDVDVILSCVDNRLARLFINRYAFLFSKPWIDGAIEHISGSVKLYRKGDCCYECNLTETEKTDINAKLSCADVSEAAHSLGSIPTTSIAASIIGAIQVQEALKLIHGHEKGLMTDSLYYEGFNNLYMNYDERGHSEDCHCQYQDISFRESSLTNQESLDDLFNSINATTNEEDPIIFLKSPLVKKVQEMDTEESFNVCMPKYKLSDTFDQQMIILDQYPRLDRQFDQMNLSMEEVGIANKDIIKYLNTEGSLKFLKLNSKS